MAFDIPGQWVQVGKTSMLSNLSQRMRSLLEVWVRRAPHGCWELIPGKASDCRHGVGRDNGSGTGLLSLGCSVRVQKCCQAAKEGWGQPWGTCWPTPPRPPPRSYAWGAGEELAWFIFKGIKFAFQTFKPKNVFIFLFGAPLRSEFPSCTAQSRVAPGHLSRVSAQKGTSRL